jgi:hypothetical protein
MGEHGCVLSCVVRALGSTIASAVVGAHVALARDPEEVFQV